MPNESSVGQDHAGWKPPVAPGILLGAKAAASSAREMRAEHSERVDFGQEQVRNDALADLQKETASLLGGVTRTKVMDTALEKIADDFVLAVADADGKLNPTLPRAAALDGYKSDVEGAKNAAISRVRQIADDFWEKFDV